MTGETRRKRMRMLQRKRWKRRRGAWCGMRPSTANMRWVAGRRRSLTRYREAPISPVSPWRRMTTGRGALGQTRKRGRRTRRLRGCRRPQPGPLGPCSGVGKTAAPLPQRSRRRCSGAGQRCRRSLRCKARTSWPTCRAICSSALGEPWWSSGRARGRRWSACTRSCRRLHGSWTCCRSRSTRLVCPRSVSARQLRSLDGCRRESRRRTGCATSSSPR
ncbi:hypothetical protein T484DRAFT_1969693 [Baffinella frigidus]|nr:hypothetical protein T484DRAFT_1969693 [Cryptophyta sp. CCMP2293]